MTELLQNKNSATRFQILIEIAGAGPTLHQKSIAASLHVTPQAVSDYIRQMMEDEMLISTGRSSYRVSLKGVNWILLMLRELKEYTVIASKAVTNVSVSAAIAEDDIQQGQTVGLKMQDGLLYASQYCGRGAKGIAVSSVKKNEDLDISNIEGIVEFIRGKVTVLQIPSILRGGSRGTDLSRLKTLVRNSHQVGAIGIESLVALRTIEIEPQYLYGVIEAAVEATQCGLAFIIVCSDDMSPDVLKRFQEEKIKYDMTDLSLKNR